MASITGISKNKNDDRISFGEDTFFCVTQLQSAWISLRM